jgi:glycosyltransferase involved in cell wall biosynthesis
VTLEVVWEAVSIQALADRQMCTVTVEPPIQMVNEALARKKGVHRMFISVVVPAYNEEKYIGRCLEALCSQTFARDFYEIIVVDNNSTDRTAAIAQEMGATVVCESIKGIGAARQRGAVAARGEVIASTDADTIVPADWLERIARRFTAEPDLGGLYGPVHHIDGAVLAQAYMGTVLPQIMHVAHTIGKPCFSGNNFAVRRDKFIAVGGYNTKLVAGEDVDLSIRMSKITRLAFDPAFIARTSSRRTQEGLPHIVVRTAASGVRLVLKGESPLPLPDIR